MTKNRKKGITLLVVAIILFITAVNMYYNLDFFINLIDPTNPIDLQGRTIIKYMAMGDTLIGLILLGFGIYFVKKDSNVL